MNTRISAVIIAFNEAHHIARCVEAAMRVADEVVVVDSFSTDQTVAVCEQLGARVIQQTWLGYSEQKNFANTQAQNDWVLSLDADEVLDEALQQAVLDWKSKEPVPAAFKRMTNYCGTFIKHGGWYPDVKIRLFNRSTTKWEGVIHESLTGLSRANTVLLDGDCLHYSYYSREQHYNQTRNFTTIQAKDLFERGKKSPWYKRVFSPVVKFVMDYVFRGGFLDGGAGFHVARISAYATYLKYSKLHEHWVSK